MIIFMQLIKVAAHSCSMHITADKLPDLCVSNQPVVS